MSFADASGILLAIMTSEPGESVLQQRASRLLVSFIDVA
jgi:hypothetical protein